MYQFAYSEICEELPPESIPKPRKLSHALELIEAVQASPLLHTSCLACFRISGSFGL